jgi:Ricin-type beta-trefoil lectin domain/Ricin-type beta-trefoil lectin domain-like
VHNLKRRCLIMTFTGTILAASWMAVTQPATAMATGVSTAGAPGPKGERGALSTTKFEITNVNSGLCLSVPGASTVPGVGLNLFPCHGYPDQWWRYAGQMYGINGYLYYMFQNVNSGLCLSVPGATHVVATQVNQWPCNTDFHDQWWTFTGFAGWENSSASQCLSVDRGRVDATAPVTQYPCGPYPDQTWLLHEAP